MGKIRTTTKATDQQVIKDQDEFCRTLDDIARKGVELDTLQAAKETAMQQVLTEHDPKISELAREIARLTKMAEQWASPRRAYLVTKVTPDKDAIRLHVKPHKLAKLGMQIKQDETFYVERSTRSDD